MFDYRAGFLQSLFTILISYSIIYHIFRNHFAGINNFYDSIYLSVVVTSTVGFGDITPITTTGKLIVVSNILFTMGVIYVLIHK
jgi:voltage-gated potassium channel Kch